MISTFLLRSLIVSVLAGSTALAKPNVEPLAERPDFDYSPLMFQQEIAQAKQIVSKDQAPSVAKDMSTGPDQAALAKAAQNPIASMISIPIQWNATPGTQWAPNSVDPDAKHDKFMNVVNIEPVFPFKLNEDWTLVTRTIIPFLSIPFADPQFGLTQAGESYVVRWNENRILGLVILTPRDFLCPLRMVTSL